MSTPFLRWTRVPIRRGYGSKMPIGTRHTLDYPRLNYYRYEGDGFALEEIPESEFRVKNLASMLDEFLSAPDIRWKDGGSQDLGVGLIYKNRLDEVDWTKMVNGVAYVFPQHNLFQHGCDYKMSEAIHPDVMAVHVYPLPFIAAMARMHISSGRDMRAFYLFGAHYLPTGENRLWKRASLHGRRSKAAQAKPMYPRRMFVICDGRLVTHRDYCMSECPRRMYWAVGICGFMSYNCIFGTDVCRQIMNEQSRWEVRFHDLFGPEAYKDSRDCILREPFEPVYVDNMVPDSKNVALEAFRAGRKATARKAGRSKRKANRICPVCWCYTRPRGFTRWYNTGCCKWIGHCGGPYLRSDYPRGKELRVVEPWKYHVLFSHWRKIAVDKLKPLVPELKDRQADMAVGSFLDRTIGKPKVPYYIVVRNKPMSKAAKTAQRCVVLTQHLARCCRGLDVVISYNEFCKLFGQKPCNTWATYEKQSGLLEFEDKTHIAIGDLCKDRDMIEEAMTWDFHVGHNHVGWRVPGHWPYHRAGYRELTAPGELARICENFQTPEQSRRNQELKKLYDDDKVYRLIKRLPVITVIARLECEGKEALKDRLTGQQRFR